MDKEVCLAGRSGRAKIVEMIAALQIKVALRNGISYLKEAYFTPPLKVANITEDKTANNLQIAIMSASPGILDGDDYQIKVVVEAGCNMQLHTQSYQRLFNMKTGATQLMEVHLHNNASFVYLPHPSVPHENASFKAMNRVHLGNHCSLVWGEVLTCGRKLNGEVFQFTKYHNDTEIFINKKLIIKENLLMQPSLINPNLMGQMEGFTHQASFIYLNENINADELCDAITDFLADKEAINFGVSAIPANGIVVRLLGYKAEQLHECLKDIHSLLQTYN